MKLLPINNPALCSVYNQYLDTNLDKLITNLCTQYDNTLSPYLNIFKEISDLSKATGRVLDSKGKLLGFNRYITFNDPLNKVLPDSDGISAYKKLMDDYKECRLSDDSYRMVLMLLSQTRTTVASIETLTEVVSTVANADIFVDDSMNMEYITYYFLDRIPGWLEVVIENFDILPRPAGMSTKYISSISRFFGFLIQYPDRDPVATSKIFSAFWKARFPIITKDIQINFKWAEQVFSAPYKLTNITQEQYNDFAKQTNLTREADYDRLLKNYERQAEVYGQALSVDKQYQHGFSIMSWDFWKIYTRAIQQREGGSGSNVLFWSALQNALGSYEYYHDIRMQETGMPRLHSIYRHDLRPLLFYDRKTGWYYYKEPDSAGNFNIHYLANLYQDDCNLWYPQDPLHLQLQRGEIHLRSADYSTTGATKVLKTSPLLDKYLHEYRSATDDNKVIIERMIENIHDASKTYHYCNKLNKFSFRAVLDFEYFNLGVFDAINSLSKANRSTSRAYYRDMCKKYVGNADSYSGRYNDREAPIYKRLQHLRYMRRAVENMKEKLTELYNKNRGYYNQYSQGIDSTIYSEISNMKLEATKEYFTDFEKSKGWGKNDEGYSAINISNKDVDYYIKSKQDDINTAESRRSAADTAEYYCGLAIDLCIRDVWEDDNARLWTRWCLSKEGHTGKPADDETWASGDYWIAYIGDYGSRKYRYCVENKAKDFKTTQHERVQKFKKQVEQYTKEKALLEQERRNRSPLTETKSLRTIMREYTQYDANINYEDPDTLAEDYLKYTDVFYQNY